MNELREVEIAGISILNENKAKSTITVLASWGKAGIENKNKRTYLQPLLQREIDRVQKSVEEGSFIGTGDHPGSGGKGKLKYIGKGKQKYIGNGKQKCIPEGKQKYTIES